jgi:hypothetical protein
LSGRTFVRNNSIPSYIVKANAYTGLLSDFISFYMCTFKD